PACARRRHSRCSRPDWAPELGLFRQGPRSPYGVALSLMAVEERPTTSRFLVDKPGHALPYVGHGIPSKRRICFGHEGEMATRLPDATVKRLPTPATGSKVYYDGDLPGFGARVTAAGARSFILNYVVKGTGRERRLTIGSATVWRTTAAREEAKRLRQEIDRGVDPLGNLQDQRAAPTALGLCASVEAEAHPRKA